MGGDWYETPSKFCMKNCLEGLYQVFGYGMCLAGVSLERQGMGS